MVHLHCSLFVEYHTTIFKYFHLWNSVCLHSISAATRQTYFGDACTAIAVWSWCVPFFRVCATLCVCVCASDGTGLFFVLFIVTKTCLDETIIVKNLLAKFLVSLKVYFGKMM